MYECNFSKGWITWLLFIATILLRKCILVYLFAELNQQILKSNFFPAIYMLGYKIVQRKTNFPAPSPPPRNDCLVSLSVELGRSTFKVPCNNISTPHQTWLTDLPRDCQFISRPLRCLVLALVSGCRCGTELASRFDLSWKSHGKEHQLQDKSGGSFCLVCWDCMFTACNANSTEPVYCERSRKSPDLSQSHTHSLFGA